MTQPTASGTLRVQVRGPNGMEIDGQSKNLDLGGQSGMGRQQGEYWGRGVSGDWEEGARVGRLNSPENTKLFMQQAGELQSGTLVHGVLKGTNLFCYWRSEDADSGQEPLFTILINKVTTPLEVRLPGACPGHLFLKALEGWAQSSETRKVDSVPQITKLQHRTGPGDLLPTSSYPK